MHPAQVGVANADAHFPAWVLHVVALGVGHIDVVVRVEEDAAGAAVLRPLRQEGAFLVEQLDAVVGTIAHKHAAALVDGDSVQRAEFAGGVAGLAPGFEEGAVGRELHHAVVAGGAVAVGHEDAAVAGDHHVGGGVELVLAAAGLAGRAEHHQHVAGGAELHHLMAARVALRDAVAGGGVGHPHIALRVHVDAVGPDEHAAAEAFHHVAGRVEFQDGVEFGIHALVTEALGRGGVAADDGPDVHAVHIHVGVAHRAHGAAVGQLGPVFHGHVGVGVRLGVGAVA